MTPDTPQLHDYHDHAPNPHPQPVQHVAPAPPLSAPEIDWSVAVPALAVLVIVVAIVAGWRRRRGR
jgi:hypothetical protein